MKRPRGPPRARARRPVSMTSAWLGRSVTARVLREHARRVQSITSPPLRATTPAIVARHKLQAHTRTARDRVPVWDAFRKRSILPMFVKVGMVCSGITPKSRHILPISPPTPPTTTRSTIWSSSVATAMPACHAYRAITKTIMFVSSVPLARTSPTLAPPPALRALRAKLPPRSGVLLPSSAFVTWDIHDSSVERIFKLHTIKKNDSLCLDSHSHFLFSFWCVCFSCHSLRRCDQLHIPTITVQDVEPGSCSIVDSANALASLTVFMNAASKHECL